MASTLDCLAISPLGDEHKKAVKEAKAADFSDNVQEAVAKAKVCLQAAKPCHNKCAVLNSIDVQHEVGEMAWLNSRHVTLKAVGTCKLLPQWLGALKILAKPTVVN